MSLAGTEFFSVNSLQLRDGAKADEGRSIVHGRRGWFDCACCPPNVMRTLASLDHLVATQDAHGLQIHQYASGTWSAGEGEETLTVSTTTDYPHDGRITVRIDAAPSAPRRLSLRIPAWSRGRARLTVDGAEATVPADQAVVVVEKEFAAGEEIVLELDMTPRFVGTHHRLDASRGAVALERGPLVYALENEDQDEGVTVDDAQVDPSAVPEAGAGLDTLDGAVPLRLAGSVVRSSPAAEAWPYPVHGSADAELERTAHTWTAIPYFAWGNRSVAAMRVWLPVQEQS